MPAVLVTGSRTGLGRALAEHLLEQGWCVHGCSRGPTAITHPAYHHTMLDVSDEPAVRAWVRASTRETGRLDGVVCNAAYVPPPAVVAMGSSEVFEQTWRTNVLGTMLVAREAVRVMSRQGSGRIVAISSMATAVCQPGTAAYTASKAAVESFIRVLARETAASGILCNVLAPSLLLTDALEVLDDAARGTALAALTLQRPLAFAEVAHALDSVLGSSNTAITGQVIRLGMAT